jgi:hypothetical protein
MICQTSYGEVYNNIYIKIPHHYEFFHINSTYQSPSNLVYIFTKDSKFYLGTVYPNIQTSEYQIINTHITMNIIEYTTYPWASWKITSTSSGTHVPTNLYVKDIFNGVGVMYPVSGGRRRKLKNKKRKITYKKVIKAQKNNTKKYKK